jgi:aminopeptidase N
MRRRRGLVALGAVIACVTSTGASANDTEFTPGAAGVGDPYFPLNGNGGYDAQHYDVGFSYDPATRRLDGTTYMTALATQNLSRFDLDLQGLDVTKVTVDGRDADFRRDGQELVITPAGGVRTGTRFTTAVTYGGVPQTLVGKTVVFGSPYGFVHTDDGAFMGDEPNAASTWFPSNDHPSDKAAFTFRATVPGDLSVIANGRLVSRTAAGGRTTFVWDERTPMATYLATADVGRWTYRSGRTPGGVPETVAVDPKLNARMPPGSRQDALTYYYDLSGEATDLWSATFGPYAFESTGAIADLALHGGRPVGFSLETQTRPLYSDVRSPTTIAHEIAHQWFGDALTIRSWADIWLNEGFATYSQWLWNEKHGGMSVRDQAHAVYDRHAATDPWWNVVIAAPGRASMFHHKVYEGGGMTLEFLRERIGDAAFSTLLRTWYAQHKYGNVTTPEFTALAGQVAHQDLGPFFRTWLYSAGKPGEQGTSGSSKD